MIYDSAIIENPVYLAYILGLRIYYIYITFYYIRKILQINKEPRNKKYFLVLFQLLFFLVSIGPNNSSNFASSSSCKSLVNNSSSLVLSSIGNVGAFSSI